MAPDTNIPIGDGPLGPRTPATGPLPLTRRERRRRVWLLSLLLALLALLAYTTYYYTQNRRLPLTGIAEPEVVPPPNYLYSITGSGADRIRYPLGVAVSAAGRVYVVDYGHGRVSVFTADGTFIRGFNELKGGERLEGPVCVAVRGDEVWVTDRQRGTIEVFDPDGTHLRTFSPKGERLEWAPLALAFDEAGRLAVTDVLDPAKHRFHLFSADGSRTVTVGYTAQVKKLEEDPGGFFFPNGIAFAGNGDVLVSDGNNRRVQVFSADGRFKSFLDTSGIPRGIVVDDEDRVLVVDALAHTVDVYSLQGRRLTQFGTRGIGPGQFNYPDYIALGRGGRIFVSDRMNDQVQVWGWPKAAPPRPPRPRSPWAWSACALPPLLVLPLLLLRRRRIVVTPDLIEALVASGQLRAIASRSRLRLVAPERDREHYAGRVEEGVDLAALVHIEPHSASDARVFVERFRVTPEQAIYLSMGERAWALATEDVELLRLAAQAGIRGLDLSALLERSGGGRSQER